MGGPCHSCNKVCEDTFAECVENDHLSWEDIREEERLENRHPHHWTLAQHIEELTNERSREVEWRDRKVREWKSQS